MSPPTFSAQGLTKIYGSGETVSLAEIWANWINHDQQHVSDLGNFFFEQIEVGLQIEGSASSPVRVNCSYLGWRAPIPASQAVSNRADWSVSCPLGPTATKQDLRVKCTLGREIAEVPVWGLPDLELASEFASQWATQI